MKYNTEPHQFALVVLDLPITPAVSSTTPTSKARAAAAMVDYSKWDNLNSDSDSDSGSGSAKAAADARRTQASTQLADDKRLLDQAEVLRYVGVGFLQSMVDLGVRRRGVSV